MTDLEITRLCAEAMGHKRLTDGQVPNNYTAENGDTVFDWMPYDPLHDDAQAMALVKRFKLGLAFSGHWSAYEQGNGAGGHDTDMNRAICECVAKMQAAK